MAAAGLGSRFSGHSGRVGLAAAGGWKSAGMVIRYTRKETARRGAVARYLENRQSNLQVTAPGRYAATIQRNSQPTPSIRSRPHDRLGSRTAHLASDTEHVVANKVAATDTQSDLFERLLLMDVEAAYLDG